MANFQHFDEILSRLSGTIKDVEELYDSQTDRPRDLRIELSEARTQITNLLSIIHVKDKTISQLRQRIIMLEARKDADNAPSSYHPVPSPECLLMQPGSQPSTPTLQPPPKESDDLTFTPKSRKVTPRCRQTFVCVFTGISALISYVSCRTKQFRREASVLSRLPPWSPPSGRVGRQQLRVGEKDKSRRRSPNRAIVSKPTPSPYVGTTLAQSKFRLTTEVYLPPCHLTQHPPCTLPDTNW
jgi:hypothetical protein